MIPVALLLIQAAGQAASPATAPTIPLEARAVRIDDVDRLKSALLETAIFDLRPLPDYLEGHIPPAVPLSLADLETAVLSGPEPDLSAVLKCLQRAAAFPGRPVLVYDLQGPDRADGWAAWLLAYSGLPDVRVLDGAVGAWFSRRLLGVYLGPPMPTGGSTLLPADLAPRPSLRVDPRDLLPQPPPGTVVVDVTPDEDGEPPGQGSLRAGELLTEQATFVFPARVRDLLRSRGIPLDRKILLRGPRRQAALVWAGLAGNGFDAALVLAAESAPPATATP